MYDTIQTLITWFEHFYNVAESFVDFITHPLGSNLDPGSVWQSALMIVLKEHGLYGLSLLEIMLGLGLAIYVTIVLAKFLLNWI